MECPGERDNLFTGKPYGRGLPETGETGVTQKNRGGWTKLLMLAGISTTVGSAMTVGYNIGVVNSPADIIQRFCNESMRTRYGVDLGEIQLGVLWSAIVSIFLVGGTIGSLSGSWLADRLGRKGGIICATLLSIAAGLAFFVSKPANSVELLIAGRLLVGLSAGLVTCIMPMYLTELAPTNLRGAMGVLCPLGITFGVLVGQVVSLRQVLGTEDLWPILLSFYLIFVFLSTIGIPFLPESPKYLFVVKNDRQLALTVLQRIRNVPLDFLADEIDELEVELKDADCKRAEDSWNLGKVLSDRALLLPLLLVCSMQAGQQFSGINAVFFYSKSIFLSAGLSDDESEYATVGAGVVNLAMAVISIYVMSRFNRRSVFQTSTFSSTICLMVLGVAITYIATISWMPYVSIAAVLGYVLCYGIGLGPIPYFIGAELFEVGPRPSAMALGSMANWGGNFIVAMTFPTMQASIGPASFYIFAFITFWLFIFVRKYLPETRGRDPSEVAHLCRLGLRSRPLASPISSSATDETFQADDIKSI